MVPPIYQRTATCPMIDARNFGIHAKTLSGAALCQGAAVPTDYFLFIYFLNIKQYKNIGT
jgi:hypothetical protein